MVRLSPSSSCFWNLPWGIGSCYSFCQHRAFHDALEQKKETTQVSNAVLHRWSLCCGFHDRPGCRASIFHLLPKQRLEHMPCRNYGAVTILTTVCNEFIFSHRVVSFVVSILRDSTSSPVQESYHQTARDCAGDSCIPIHCEFLHSSFLADSKARVTND